MEQIKMIQLTTTSNKKVLININNNITFIEVKNNVRILEGLRILFDVTDSMESIINKLTQINIQIAE